MTKFEIEQDGSGQLSCWIECFHGDADRVRRSVFIKLFQEARSVIPALSFNANGRDWVVTVWYDLGSGQITVSIVVYKSWNISLDNVLDGLMACKDQLTVFLDKKVEEAKILWLTLSGIYNQEVTNAPET
jgi:hypothetical protein